MTDRELMQMALDALELITSKPEKMSYYCSFAVEIEALRARLAQPEQEIEPDRPHVEDDGCPTEKAVLQRFWREHQMQEPVAWADKYDIERAGHDFYANRQQPAKGGVPLYTAPPQREWQGLTDEEIEDACWTEVDQRLCSFARAIEAKLKEKNA